MARTRKKTARRVVPLRRTLRRGDHGPDVIGLKRALTRAKCYKARETLTNNYGPACEQAVKTFQKRKKLAVDGVYGRQTHRRLRPYYDAYAALLMHRAPKQAAPGLTLRGKIVNEAVWGYNARAAIHYVQFRPMRTLHAGHILPQSCDCSEFATTCYYRSGGPDPNARGYDGLGYTGTLASNGLVVSTGNARPGDLVFYGGGWPWEHVAVYVGHGRVVSHGSEGGPYLVSMDYRGDRGAIRSYV